jgi:uncharacterized protein YciI
MPYFATTYRYTDDTERRDAVRPTHREFLAFMTGQGRLAVSGPYVGGETPGALLVFIADDEASARALTAEDPFVLAGLVAEIVVREWQPVSGSLGQHF